MAGELVGRDADEPGPCGRSARFETIELTPTTFERDRREIVGERVVAGPASDEAMDVVDMTTEQDREQLGFVTGAPHECRVVESVD